jgi:hypothetical protein
MKKCIIFVVFVVAVSLAFQMCGGETAAQKAKRRVETMLNGITSQDEGRTLKGDEVSALCMWWNGSLRSFDGEMPDKISDAFDRWRTKGDVLSYITEFTITDAESSGVGVVVSGTIEGAPFKMQVTPGKPITWLQPPVFEEEE